MFNIVTYVKRCYNKVRLDSKLDELVEQARGHERDGMPSGSMEYRALYDQALAFIAGAGEDPDKVKVRSSAFNQLSKHAFPEKPGVGAIGKVLGIILMVMLGAGGIGTVLGLIDLAYHLVGGR